jgi:hypothetical protein
VRVFVMGGGSGRRNAAGRLDHGGHALMSCRYTAPKTVSYGHHRGRGVACLAYQEASHLPCRRAGHPRPLPRGQGP